MYLSDLEEIIVLIAAFFIVVGFVVKAYKDIKETVAEEKRILNEGKKNEEKIKILTQYIDSKNTLIQNILKAKKKLNEKAEKPFRSRDTKTD
jgi:archaellum component FlaF (FlaF/FlaG flagellin family)